MKIAIIGGGFYGCYLAKKFKEKLKSKIQIDIFEKNNSLISEAGNINQHRLHLGFHYPRSMLTIKQALTGSRLFKKEFKKFIFFPKKNFYLIHKNSHVNYEKFIKIYKKLKIYFKEHDIEKIKFLKNKNEYKGVINTKEGVILFDKLNLYLKKIITKYCNVFKNTKIAKINSLSGIIYDNKGKSYKDYNYILNCSYTDPNLGIKKKYKIKYELAGIVKIKNPFKESIGITIMDGPFIALYPRDQRNSSLSSVNYTPISKFTKLSELNKFQKNFYPKQKKYKSRIINDVKKYFKQNFKIKNPKLLIAPKVKITHDIYSQRPAMLRRNHKTISVLCGKLDATPLVYNKILNIILKTKV